MKGLFVFVVLLFSTTDGKQEKIGSENSLQFPLDSSRSAFDVSFLSFNPFTPFPDQLTTPTSRPQTTVLATTNLLKETTPINLVDMTTTNTLVETTTNNQETTTIQPPNNNESQRSQESDDGGLRFRQALDFSADGVSRKEVVDEEGTIHGSYSYPGPNGILVTVNYEAGKDGYKIVSDKTKESSSSIKSLEKTSNRDWVQSILSRTTRRPTTTTPLTTTTAATTTETQTTLLPTTLTPQQVSKQQVFQPQQKRFQQQQQRFPPQQKRIQSQEQAFELRQQRFQPQQQTFQQQEQAFPPYQQQQQPRFQPQQQRFQPQQQSFQQEQLSRPNLQQLQQILSQRPIAEQSRSQQAGFVPQQQVQQSQLGKSLFQRKQQFQSQQQPVSRLDQSVFNQQKIQAEFLRKNQFRLSVQQPRQNQFERQQFQQQSRSQQQFQQRQGQSQVFNQQTFHRRFNQPNALSQPFQTSF